MYHINCELCGKSCIGERKSKRFCSKLCISRYNNPPKGRKKGKFVACTFCSKPVWTMRCKNNFKNRYCNRDCMIASMKKNSFNFPCKICGTSVFTQPAQLKLRARSTCSPHCRRILAIQRAVERRLKNGVTKHQIDRAERYSVRASDWRKSVFKRDNYTCQICLQRGKYLEADHIKPWAYFPELRFELSNGRTLCRPCHDKTKISYKKMKEIYGKKE